MSIVRTMWNQPLRRAFEWIAEQVSNLVGDIWPDGATGKLDEASGRRYASFPVTIGVADYEEFYALDDDQYREWIANPILAIPFVEECRKREHDDLLMQQPVWNRGIPISQRREKPRAGN